jgi:type III secretion protein R
LTPLLTHQAPSQPLSLALTLLLLGLLPIAFLVLTSFVKISTVLQIAKSSLGAQGIPSSTVVMALSVALTFLVMAPVGERMLENLAPAWAPASSNEAATPQALSEAQVKAWQSAREPLREFLQHNASERELKRFLQLARDVRPADQRDSVQAHDFAVIIPAFLVSELLEAFMLGFAIFLPFLVIDLVTGNVLLGLGLTSLSVTQASLPFKLLLFVVADGWGLLAQALIADYRL